MEKILYDEDRSVKIARYYLSVNDWNFRDAVEDYENDY